jgi:hypothetical protein
MGCDQDKETFDFAFLRLSVAKCFVILLRFRVWSTRVSHDHIFSCSQLLFRLGELLVIIPMHVVCIVSTFSFLRNVLPEQVASQALDPIEYSHDGNPWIVVRF